MKTSYFIILIITTFLIISCEKLIDVDIPDNQIDKESVFKDTQTANAALAALYADIMKSSPIAGGDLETYLSSYTDELDNYTTAASDVRDIFLNQQIDTNGIVYNVWASAYKNIYTANSILEGVQGSNGISPSDKKYLRGEALLIRSIMFFYLNQLYGDIPYPQSTDYNINNILYKTTYTQVLSNIEQDLLEVSTLLQNDYRSSERIYPNRIVARLVLAKVYMARHEWDKAENTLKEIVQSPIYQIEPDVTKVFQKTGKHILWQLKPNNNLSLRQASIYYFINASPSTYALSSRLINSFANDDLRKQKWMASVTFNGITYFRAEKYKNRGGNNMTEYSIIFRLEEAYLLLAEALAQQDKVAEALPYINRTRQRAQLPLLTLPITKNILLDEILLEDKREFFTEMGHRFLDLKRTGKLNMLQTTKPNWKDFHQLWPIPQKEILLNVNLKPQNTGY
ncbi:RagB/SusD family nutrient uptake outer membrane protein [Sphingobacterium athyrii]|uniref:RagB/SusD family nutrient uptake outer membrane protein n=1 Tax=Sphingobacterium athyrii TaxID=2152717 RepID=A0A363NUD2_9SPHI|nr:RagB/SusD family nutrient uptake outer membrane protein [Sphingobacterium athyrii]PUV24422.1 RagB/SusD family nutrient uptake outer membrane protein [Sphingobacterium athyrii]